MVMGNVGVERHLDRVARAFALQLPTALVWIARLDAVVNGRVQGGHFQINTSSVVRSGSLMEFCKKI
jgi:hypothetical protein